MAVALYRRYRPETFADVIGQEHVTGPLMQALRTGRVNHAYLFSGPRGCGKTTSARILARCLNCAEGPTPTPCGHCDSCVALARGGPGTVDVIEIDAASHGGVDDARDLRERASYGPAQSRYKIYIIDEAHMVTPQGFNALLKIVEEPPEHVKFVFATTEPEKVIGTIRSRTHHYPFRLVPPGQLQTYLEHLCEQEGVTVAPGVLSFVIRAGGGSVRDSLSVLDQLIAGSGAEGLTYESAAALLGFTDGELLDATIDAFAAADPRGAFSAIERVIESGLDPRRFVEDLLERLRDLIIVAAIPDGTAAVLRGLPADQLDRMRAQAAAFGVGALSRAADIANAALTEMTGATAPRLHLELLTARILLPGAAGEAGYAARLDRLERRLDVGGAPSSIRGNSARESAREYLESGGEAESAPSAPPASPPAPSPAPSAAPPTPKGPGGLDVAGLRRAWPDVLAKLFELRRTTWTFVSQHAQVIDYDGERIVLGIATTGLTQTFRRGPHADYLRQALIDALGVEAQIEGVSAEGAAARAEGVGPAPVMPAPVGPPDPGAPSASRYPPRVSPSAHSPGGAPRSAPPASPAPPSSTAEPPPSRPAPTPRPSGAAYGGPGGYDTGPSWAEAPSHPESAPSWATEDESPYQRAQRVAADDPDPDEHIADDSAVSEDDEDIEALGEVGVPVVERLLGGTIIKDEIT
ncbi:MAG TPA: DNA polymerase III subunit gamma and tau [Phycicoccus sp.]|nr:DNA polymerase III subunit gamma and tau [Phycicoccus sp.]